MKEMTSVATTMMSEEEKAEMERELNEGRGPASPAATTPPHGVMPTSPSPPPNGAAHTDTPLSQPADAHVHTNGGTPAAASSAVSPLPLPDNEHKHLTSPGPKEREAREARKKAKITPEQKKKLQELEEERRKNMEERIDTLTKKLVERLRPFVHAKRPGDKDDPETQAFEAKMRREADDMKLESFGVEVRPRAMSPGSAG